jgi:hypothetical protein
VKLAILESRERRLTYNCILDWIANTFSYYKKRANESDWKESVRYCLNHNKSFARCGTTGGVSEVNKHFLYSHQETAAISATITEISDSDSESVIIMDQELSSNVQKSGEDCFMYYICINKIAILCYFT